MGGTGEVDYWIGSVTRSRDFLGGGGSGSSLQETLVAK